MFMRPAFRVVLPTLLAIGASASTCWASVVSDGDFSSWTMFTNQTGNSYTVVGTGGNPGAYANFQFNAASHSINMYSAYIKQDYTNTLALTGQTFTMVADRNGAINSPTSSSVNLGFAIQQGSNVWYYTGTELSSYSGSWATSSSVSGSFSSGSFSLITGSGSPNFAAGVATKFGFYSHTNNPAGTYAMAYDNYQLTTSGSLSAVPEPSTLAIGVAIGVITGGCAQVRRGKRRLAREDN